jgi:hypothetical protein
MTQEKDKRINNRLCMLAALKLNDTKNTFISPITSIGKLNEVE